jgi:putative glutamine amidotransferase
MTAIAISTTIEGGGEYAAAIAASGGEPLLLPFDPAKIHDHLADSAGVLLSGGGDVDPTLYGERSERASEVDQRRDAFELTLVRRARELGLPTLCICRGVQLANVAFGGTLVDDIGSVFGPATAVLHRQEVDGASVRGLIDGHTVAIRPNSLLAAVVANESIVTGSRHHQSIARVAPDLEVVAATPDGIVEAVEARFSSPFWLGVQWHPESTLAADDGGASSAIFAAFIAAAGRFAAARNVR